jgi:hypothetical protein
MQKSSEMLSKKHFVPLDTDGGVKVLSEKMGSNDNFQNDRFDTELVPASIGNLPDEIMGLLN